MDTNSAHSITAETAELASKAIKDSGHSLAEVSRRTLIPYVTLHRKVNGVADLSVRDLASISIALHKPFIEFLPRHLMGGK